MWALGIRAPKIGYKFKIQKSPILCFLFLMVLKIHIT